MQRLPTDVIDADTLTALDFAGVSCQNLKPNSQSEIPMLDAFRNMSGGKSKLVHK